MSLEFCSLVTVTVVCSIHLCSFFMQNSEFYDWKLGFIPVIGMD